MAITYTDNGTNTPNGTHKIFTYTFPVLQTEDIKVALNGIVQATTKYTASLSPAQIEFNNTNTDATVQNTSTGAPLGGVQVRVFRETTVGKNSGDEDPKAFFVAGSSIRAADLNDNFEQLLFGVHELQDQPVKTSDIEPDAVTNSKIVDNAIDSEHYVDGSIDRVHLEADIIDGSKIEDNAVDNEHIAANAVRTSEIQNTAVTQNKLANNSVGTTELINGSVNSDKILDGTIVNADISSSAAIDASKIVSATGSVAGTMSAADKAKLDGIESGAKDDQTAAEIKTLLQSNKITDSEISTGTLDNRYFTETELTGGALDGRYFTETESDARYFNVSTGDTIKDGDTFPDNDTTIATTAAINDRIIDLVDDVGGFVPIANETSFPTSNPDVNNGAGTIVSVSAASTNLVPSGTTVTIANGRGSGLAVIITGVSATIPSGFGFLVETTTTDHTYTFHRLVPKATEVTTVASNATQVQTVHTNISNINAVAADISDINTVAADATDIGAVAGKATEIGRLGTADAVADMAILGTADVVADLNTLGTADVVADMNMLATSDVISDMNTLAVSDVISDMNDLATSGNITAMSTCSTNIASINNCSTNISSANTFGDQYQVASNNPSTDGGGNALAAGDLYFNTSANELKVYNGSSWQGGVTAAGSFAATTGNTFTGDNRYNDGVKALFGTGSDLEIFHDNSAGATKIINTTSNPFIIQNTSDLVKIIGGNRFEVFDNLIRFRTRDTTETYFTATQNGSVELYYDNVKRFQTTANGALIGASYTAHSYGDDLIVHNSGDNCGITIAANSAGRSSIFFADAQDSNIGFMEYNHSANRFRLYVNDILGFQITDDTTVTLGKGSWGGSSQVKVYGNTGSVKKDGLLVLNATASVAQRGAGVSVGGNTERIASFYCKKDTATDSDGGNAFLESKGDLTLNVEDSETGIDINGNGSVELYYDNSKKFETTSSGVKLGDNLKVEFGDDDDLEIYYHSSTDKNIINSLAPLRLLSNGNTTIESTSGEVMIKAVPDAAVELYHNNSKKFETTSAGVDITGNITVTGTVDGVDIAALNTTVGNITTDVVSDTSPQLGGTLDTNGNLISFPDSGGVNSNRLKIGSGNDIEIFHVSDNSYFDFPTGYNTYFRTGTNRDTAILVKPDNAVELYYDNSKKFETTSTGANLTGRLVTDSITIEDDGSNEPLFWLRADDGSPWAFVIGNDNSNTSSSVGLKWYVANNGNAYQQLRGNSAFEEFHLQQSDGSTTNTGIRLNSSRAVELNYQGSEKLSTKSTGVEITGNLDIDGNIDGADGSKIKLGTGDDLQIFHDGSNSYVREVGTGNLFIESPNNIYIGKSTGGAENCIVAKPDGSVELYHDNNKVFETLAAGIRVQRLTATSTYIELQNSGGVAGYLYGQSNDQIQLMDREGHTFLKGIKDGSVELYHDNSKKFETNANGVYLRNGTGGHWCEGHFYPWSNNTYNLGSASYRWANVYTNDLNLSNEGSSNDVDGTWGDWTIQEGESDLFLKNNRSGKKYKFNLTEVS